MHLKIYRRFLCPVLMIFFFSICSTPVSAGQVYDPELQNLIHRIEQQRFSWYGFRAMIKLNFVTAEDRTASCRGQLTYMRLDEKMLLECFNEQNERLFAFKTSDLEFELLMPRQKVLYRGNIFDLENNADVSSHIKAFDLYRAIKPMAIPADRAHLDYSDRNSAAISIRSARHGQSFVSRKLTASPRGDVLSEFYFSPDGTPSVSIFRRDFKQVYSNDTKSGEPIIFPFRIRIENPEESNITEMVFFNIQFLWSIPETLWSLEIPAGTQIMTFPEIPKAPLRGEYI